MHGAGRPDAMIVPLGDAAEALAMRVLADLRVSGIAVDMAFRGNMKKRIAKADAAGPACHHHRRQRERSGRAAGQEMERGEQQAVPLAGLAEALRR